MPAKQEDRQGGAAVLDQLSRMNQVSRSQQFEQSPQGQPGTNVDLGSRVRGLRQSKRMTLKDVALR